MGRAISLFVINEEVNPREPLHVERGYDADVSTVTVMAGRGTLEHDSPYCTGAHRYEVWYAMGAGIFLPRDDT